MKKGKQMTPFLKGNKYKSNISKQAITIVELIVVITILAILGTIAFLSFNSYLADSRDSVRISDLKNIEKVIELQRIKDGHYVSPDNAVAVSYSWATVWNQWIFWSWARRAVKDLSVVPVDPLTKNEYTYSVLNTGLEYQLGAILENGETVALNPTITHSSYADVSSATSYISWNYNWQVAKASTGGIDYVLAVPSIIASDLSNTDLINIVNNKKLSVKNYKNIPHSYNISYTPKNSSDVKFVNTSSLVVWSGSTSNLSDTTNLKLFADNLQSAYKELL